LYANKLALAISHLHQRHGKYDTMTMVDLKSQWDPRAPIEHVKAVEEVKYVVDQILVGGALVELYPRITLEQGTITRHFDTPGYSHTLKVMTDFVTGSVTTKFTSWEHCTNEEVYIASHWRVDRIISTTRKNLRKRHA
jgi:hypothetical protein